MNESASVDHEASGLWELMGDVYRVANAVCNCSAKVHLIYKTAIVWLELHENCSLSVSIGHFVFKLWNAGRETFRLKFIISMLTRRAQFEVGVAATA